MHRLEIAAAAGGFAGASEFKANQKALSVAKTKRMVAEELDAMAEQASDSLSGNMTTADQLAANANAAWGPGELPNSFYIDSHLEFDGDNLSIVDNFSNGTTNVRDSFSAVSGPYGNGAIPSGDWNTGNVISPTGNVGMSVGTSDFAIELDANFNLNGRNGFYIHPDGNVPGTLGCIGLNCGVDRINDFLTAYRNYYNRNGSMNLIVD